MPINQPSNQIKLTNVSIVRLKKGGKRFEIAAYPNTVKSWRAGVEKDISEVLQIESIFVNTSKGQLAKHEDLQKAFGTTDVAEIAKIVLDKGELQVGGKEREAELDSLRKEISTGVAERCVDPTTQLPHTVTMIEKALNDIHFNVQPTKAVKSQILDAIRRLQEAKTLPIQRARMRIRLTMPSKEGKRLKEEILNNVETVEEDEWSEQWELVALIDPGSLRIINELLQKEVKGKDRARVETLSFAAMEGEERIE